MSAQAAAGAGSAAAPPLPGYLPFEWIVAIRFLREGRLQTLFIVVGVAIGVAVIVFMSALLSGLQGNFVRRALTGQPHIQMLPPRDTVQTLQDGGGARVQPPLQRLRSIDQWPAVMAQVERTPGVRVVSPGVSGAAFAQRGDASRGISLVGVEPDRYLRIVLLRDQMVTGRAEVGAGEILIGTELASDLSIRLGDKLRVSTASTPVPTNLIVAGIFDLGNKGANSRTTYVALRTAQSLLGLPGGVTVLDVTVDDVYAAERVAQSLSALTGVQADSWIRTNQQFFSAVSAQTTANTAIRFFVGLSVAFGIASVLVVSVVQRGREIGILRAMGIRRGQIMRIFLLQGGLLGLAGSAAGSLVGAGALVVWVRTVRTADGTPIFPLEWDARLYLAALGLATLTGLLAAVAPALRAARLDPVVAIRG